MNNIAIFASGSGTNAQRIIEYFGADSGAKVKIVLTNNKNAGVVERARKMNVPVKIFDSGDFYGSDRILKLLSDEKIDLLVLAGFLRLVPENLLAGFPDRIINIHPALLPKYGGKGMYGMNVHRAVIEAGERESGITVHYVNERYDEGNIIFQAKVAIDAEDTPESLACKIHGLEYEHFPRVIENLLRR